MTEIRLPYKTEAQKLSRIPVIFCPGNRLARNDLTPGERRTLGPTNFGGAGSSIAPHS
jgi:hypothetical protein